MPPRASREGENKAASDTSKRRVTTPILLQMHASECGAACLGSILAYFGRWVPLSELREKCEVSRDGSSAASILRASRNYGLECSGLSLRAEQLKKLDLPLILFWQFSHFVVLEGFDGRNYYLNDPSTGRRRLSAEEFTRGYSGIALRFKRGDDFSTGGEPPGLLGHLGILLPGSWNVLTGVIACGLMLTLLALIVPASLTVFVDDVLEKHGAWGGLVAALIGGGVLVYVLSLLKHRFLKRLAIRISVVGYSRGLSRLLRLPVEFFEHRLAGDLTDRVSSIDRVAKNLTDQFLVLVIDIAMSAVLVVAMLVYDVLLTVDRAVAGRSSRIDGPLSQRASGRTKPDDEARTGAADRRRHADAPSCGQFAPDGSGRPVFFALERSASARTACAPALLRTELRKCRAPGPDRRVSRRGDPGHRGEVWSWRGK